MHIYWRRRSSISRMLMEQHHLETKCSRPPQCRRLASDRKDRLRASLNAARGLKAFAAREPGRDVNDNDRKLATRRQRSRAQFVFLQVERRSTRDAFPSAFDENETSTEFPNAGQAEFPNALEILGTSKPVFITKSARWFWLGREGSNPLKN